MSQQTRNPTSDIAFTGTWTGTAGSRYQNVDDHPDSTGADKLTHGTTAGKGLFGYLVFSAPVGATIQSVQVVYYDQKTGGPAASWGAFLRVNGAEQAVIDAHNPANGTWTLRTATMTTNPVTGQAWTVDQVNGVGSNALDAFGLIATDASPTIEVASIQLLVNYLEPTRGLLSFSEAEVPFVLTRGFLSFAEVEVPFVNTRGLVAFAEFEAPLVPTRGRVSWAEAEVPDASIPTRGLISFVELETPLAPTRGLISWSEGEVPDAEEGDGDSGAFGHRFSGHRMRGRR